MDTEQEDNMEAGEARVYELSFLLDPEIGDENIAGAFSAVKEIVEATGATFIVEEFPKMIHLAYDIKATLSNKKRKFADAYFGWMKFEATSDNVEKIQAGVKASPTIFRYLLIKTARENTMAVRRMVRPDSRKRKTGADGEKDAAPVTAEESEAIDKKIEEFAVV